MINKHKDSVISILIITIFVAISFAVSYPTDTKPFKFLGMLIIYYGMLIVGITGTLIKIITRSPKKNKYNFSYNFFGTLNLTTGFAGLIFASGDTDKLFILIIISLVLGMLTYYDIYFSK